MRASRYTIDRRCNKAGSRGSGRVDAHSDYAAAHGYKADSKYREGWRTRQPNTLPHVRSVTADDAASRDPAVWWNIVQNMTPMPTARATK